MGSSNPAAKCQFNWAYNSEKRSYRYDRVNSPDISRSAAGGVLHGNLAWNASASFVKGDAHIVSNNVAWMPVTRGVPDISGNSMALIVLGPNGAPYAFDWENTHTVVQNNGAPSMGSGAKNHSFAGPSASNVEAKVEEELVDVITRDFRPKKNSQFAMAGVGPYSVDGSDYFIPGHQLHAASHPIPSSGASEISLVSPLLFKPGFAATDHEVYLSEMGGEMQRLPSRSTSHGRGAHLAEIERLRPGTTYQWRVVTKHVTHDVEGPMWTFTTEMEKPFLV